MREIKIKSSNNNLVKKHNELIKNARYSLSEMGIKVVSCLIAMIKVDDKDFQEYHLNINDFKELIGSNSKDTYKYTHLIIKELLSNPIKIDDKQFNWISYGEYKEGSNIIIFDVHKKLRPYLLELKQNFIRYNIQDILSLKSSYVIRFYELIVMEWKQYKAYNPTSERYTFSLEIDMLINLFEIPNTQKYADIKRHIIDKAKKQFIEKTSIKFEYKEIKKVRKVVAIEITISDNIMSYKSFIEYLRKEKINQDLYTCIDKDTKKEMILSISQNGRLYDKLRYNFEFTKDRANELYLKIYELYATNKLNIKKINT